MMQELRKLAGIKSKPRFGRYRKFEISFKIIA